MKSAIALFSLTRIFGGGEVYYVRLCELLQDQFDIHAIVSNEELASRLAVAHIDVELLPADKGLQRWRAATHALRNSVERNRIRVVHLNGQAEANLVPLCRRLGVRTVITRHTDLQLHTGLVKRALYRRNAALADAIICVSQQLASVHSPFIAPEKLHVIPHWMTPVPSALAKQGEPFTVLFMGRIEREKGIAELVAAAKRLPDVQFLVAGEGKLRTELEADPQLHNMRFVGFQKKISEVFAQAHLLVHPSHSEGSSLVVLEAMAHNVPCLVSDIPALRELADQGRRMALFHCGDADSLTNAIRKLQATPEERLRLAGQARSSIKTSYSPDRARKLYTGVLSA